MAASHHMWRLVLVEIAVLHSLRIEDNPEAAIDAPEQLVRSVSPGHRNIIGPC